LQMHTVTQEYVKIRELQYFNSHSSGSEKFYLLGWALNALESVESKPGDVQQTARHYFPDNRNLQ
jgi:hypothetical protein